jgi:malonyl-CoA/methylmalonyl-CoA synthetase
VTNTLYEALFAPHASNTSPFLDCDDGQSQSYAEFIKRAAQIAHVLQAAGVKAGDRVVVQAPKTRETVALYAACVQAGAVYLPLNNAYTLDEVSYFVGDAKPAVIVCDPKDATMLADLAQTHAATLLTLGTEGGTLSSTADAKPTDFATVERAPDDLAALLYTSGTTGRSKGAMLTHKNLLSNARALTDLWRITDQDRLLHALPIFHTHGLFVALNTSLLAGVSVRLMEKFDLSVLLAEMPKASVLMGVPTFYTRLLGSEEFSRELTANMRLFVSGSAPLLAETHVAFEARTGHRILERYGMTETNMITSNPYDGERIAGTVGYALPGTDV